MAENFSFNAPQFVDFANGLTEEDIKNVEAYFEVDHEQFLKGENGLAGEVEIATDQDFTPPEQQEAKHHLRRSMSAGNILPTSNANNSENDELNSKMDNLNIENSNTNGDVKQNNDIRRSKSRVSNAVRSRSACRDKLSQPKSNKALPYKSTAETVLNFQKGFRAEQMMKPFHNRVTIPESPALKTKQRVRPSEVPSKEEQEQKQLEDAKKYRIKAKPVNAKILYGPVKPQAPIQKKETPLAVPHKTAPAKKETPAGTEPFKFHARPVPKATYSPVVIRPRTPTGMKSESLKPMKPLQKHRSLDHVDHHSNVNKDDPLNLKSSTAELVPLSFEERNKQLQKRKDEYVNKVLEEEKKAREFHAKPLPKYLQHVCLNSSHNEAKKKNDSMENNHQAFKARPATVLHMKPFEPKREEKPLTEITEFQLNTDRRAKERERFEQDLKKKQDLIEQLKKEEEEKLLAEEQNKVTELRKQAEYKANPVRHFKEVVIKKSMKITVPISPRFLVEERLRNKENNAN